MLAAVSRQVYLEVATRWHLLHLALEAMLRNQEAAAAVEVPLEAGLLQVLAFLHLDPVLMIQETVHQRQHERQPLLRRVTARRGFADQYLQVLALMG